MDVNELSVIIDNAELIAVIDVAREHIECWPEFEECFEARFPRSIDLIEVKTVGPSKLKVRPSDAFKSFMQDLVEE